jgi:very-short-patch-repair endonuclease
MHAEGLDEGMVREYRFAQPRRFSFDFAWPDKKVFAEVDGGTWSYGRHVRGSGFMRDCEKMNLASSLGWRGYRFTPEMIGRYAVEIIREGIKVRKGAE